MLLPISNSSKSYAWGSHTAIAALQQRPASAEPEAELWLGTHPGGPSTIEGTVTRRSTLDAVTTLPFLLKLLAAASPLSLQVHPTLRQASAGYRDEELAGIPAGSPARNFKDAMHKPEMVVALSHRFIALCGFRPIEESATSLHTVVRRGSSLEGLLQRVEGNADLADAVAWLLGTDPEAAEAVKELESSAKNRVGDDWQTVRELGSTYPGDPGIAVAFLMNRVSLERGQALFLAAGEIHSYLNGFGVEIMAASDNVLRAGLTPKHVDVQAVLDTGSFAPSAIPYVVPQAEAIGFEVFRPPVEEFALARVSAAVEPVVAVFGREAIVLCTRGSAVVNGHTVAQGHAAYLSADESPVTLTGDAEVYIASGSDLAACPC